MNVYSHARLARRMAALSLLLVTLPAVGALAAPPAAGVARLAGVAPPAATRDADEPWNVSLSGEYAYIAALATHAQRQADLGAVAQRRAASPLVRDLAYGLARHGTQVVEELRALGRAIELQQPVGLTWLDLHHLRGLRAADTSGDPAALDLAYLRLVRVSLDVALLAADDGIDTCHARRAVAAHARRTRDVLAAQLAYLDQVRELRGGGDDTGGALGPVPGDDDALP